VAAWRRGEGRLGLPHLAGSHGTAW